MKGIYMYNFIYSKKILTYKFAGNIEFSTFAP